MATATWMLRKTSTGTILWHSEGACPPDVLVDPAQIRDTFALSFPTVLIEFGAGDFDLMVVSMGAAYRAGGVAAYTLPGKARVGDASQVHLTSHASGSEARIVTGKGFEMEVAGLTRTLPCDVAPTKVDPPPQRAADGSSVAHLMASTEPADFQMLIRVVATKVLQRSEDWADRCRDLPKAATLARADRRATEDEASNAFLSSRCYVGWEALEKDTVGVEVFTYAPCCKTSAYLRLLRAFQDLEALPPENTASTLTKGLRISLQMMQDAHLLHLIEKGSVGGEILHPDNEVFDAEVDAEMEARANFVAAKDAEYGQAIRRHGINGALVRLWDKLSRYTNLKAQSHSELSSPKFESMADTAKDLGGYTLILAGLFQEALEASGVGATTCPLVWAKSSPVKQSV